MHTDFFRKWASDFIVGFTGKSLRRRFRGNGVRVLGWRFMFVWAGVIFPTPGAADVSLQHLAPGAGFYVEGDFSSVTLGNDISCVGDVNGDGYDDFVVGRRFQAGTLQPLEDAAYLIFGNGSPAPPDLNVADLDGTNGVKLVGFAGRVTQFGTSVSAAGDVNGDGINDFIIGAPRAPKLHPLPPSTEVVSGLAYIVNGRESWPSTIYANFLVGQGGTMLNGENHNDHTGIRVASAGDVNGDGFSDVIVHSRHEIAGIYNYKTYVVFGKSDLGGPGLSWFELGSLNGQNGFSISGVSYFPASQYPLSVAGAGDVNGDGYDDVIIAGRGFAGSFGYVIFGRGGNFAATVNPHELTGNNGFRFNVPSTGESRGLHVASVGDFNGDGYADFVVGPGNTPDINSHRDFYVVFGRASWSGTLSLPGYLNGSNGSVISGPDMHWTPSSLAGAGDVDGDGYSDLLLATPYMYGYYLTPQGGRTFLINGKPSYPARKILVIDSEADFSTMYGGGSYYYSGTSVSGAGDFNNDGFQDLLIAAPLAGNYGRAFMVFGAGDAEGSATYKSYSRNADSPRGPVGIPGNAGDGTSPSRVWLDFSMGKFASLEQATITRTKANVSGFSRPEEVADVTWKVETSRITWGEAEVTFKYTDQEVAGLPGGESDLTIYRAPDVSGPWTQLPTANVGAKKLTATVAEGMLGHFAIATSTAMEASVDEWFLY